MVDEKTAHFQLAFSGIAVATAVFAGALVSLLALCCRDPELDYRSNLLMSNDYGLYRNTAKK